MTNSAHFSQITDELLSAYLDQEVTPEEKNLVEAAIAADAEIAWRLHTLRQTVQLLRTLPAVTLPRSFVLTEAQLAAAPQEVVVAHPARPVPARLPPAQSAPSGWQTLLEGWRNFWQAGSPLLRNAMAASFALLLVLLLGDRFLTTVAVNGPNTAIPRSLRLEVLPTHTSSPTVVIALVPAPTKEVVAESAAAASTTEDAQEVAAASVQRTSPTTTQSTALTGNAPPGEAPSVDLAPGGGEEMASAAAFDQANAGGEQSPPAAMVAADQPMTKQAAAATTDTLTSANFISPLALPDRLLAVTNAITATGRALGEVSTLTNTEASTATGGVAPSVAVEIAPPASPLLPAEQAQAGESSSTDRIRLLQIVSALVTLALAGLWWRSR